MSVFTILRTAVGSPVAPFVINEIRKSDCRVIGTDLSNLSCGFAFSNLSYLVPRVNDRGYLSELLKICLKEQVDFFWPDLDEEFILVSENRNQFEAIGTRVFLADTHALRICTDKWQTYLTLKQIGLPVPITWNLDEHKLNQMESFPIIIKPKQGRGSQGIKILWSEDELNNLGDTKGYVAQEYIEGKEYTIDVLSDLEGKYLYSAVRERIATDSGISVKGRTVKHDVIERYVALAANAIGLKGPSCFQCMENAEGRLAFIEINPRIAGTVALSVLAGAPIIADCIRLMKGEQVEKPVNYKYGVEMARYWSEVVFNT